jgi:hypothetical protein
MGYCKEEKGGMVKKTSHIVILLFCFVKWFEIICAEPAEVSARFVDI